MFVDVKLYFDVSFCLYAHPLVFKFFLHFIQYTRGPQLRGFIIQNAIL